MRGTKRPSNGRSGKQTFTRKKVKKPDSFTLSLADFNTQDLENSVASSSTLHEELSFSSDKRRVNRRVVEAPLVPLVDATQPQHLDNNSLQDFQHLFAADAPEPLDDAPPEESDEEDEDELEDGHQRARRYASSVSPF